MKFTYDAYKDLIELIKEHGYHFADYHNWQEVSHPCIMRHDADNSLEKAAELAKIEKTLGVKSTYFVLASSDFYNICSRKSRQNLRLIIDCGHEVGLHFDETAYAFSDYEEMAQIIVKEGKILREVLNFNGGGYGATPFQCTDLPKNCSQKIFPYPE